jgi:hypothetical protein
MVNYELVMELCTLNLKINLRFHFAYQIGQFSPKPTIHTIYQFVLLPGVFYFKPMRNLLRYFAVNQL